MTGTDGGSVVKKTKKKKVVSLVLKKQFSRSDLKISS